MFSLFRPCLCSQKKEETLWESKFQTVPDQKYSIKDIEAATPIFHVGKGHLQDQIQLKKLMYEAGALAFHLHWLHPPYILVLSGATARGQGQNSTLQWLCN